MLNVLKEMKYYVKLKMLWLRNQNPIINWTIRKLCVNKIKDQIAELLKHKPWDHKMTLLSKKQLIWKSLYFMSENQLKYMKKFINENLKREFIRLLSSSVEYSVIFIFKKDGTKQLCIDY